MPAAPVSETGEPSSGLSSVSVLASVLPRCSHALLYEIEYDSLCVWYGPYLRLTRQYSHRCLYLLHSHGTESSLTCRLMDGDAGSLFALSLVELVPSRDSACPWYRYMLSTCLAHPHTPPVG